MQSELTNIWEFEIGEQLRDKTIEGMSAEEFIDGVKKRIQNLRGRMMVAAHSDGSPYIAYCRWQPLCHKNPALHQELYATRRYSFYNIPEHAPQLIAQLADDETHLEEAKQRYARTRKKRSASICAARLNSK